MALLMRSATLLPAVSPPSAANAGIARLRPLGRSALLGGWALLALAGPATAQRLFPQQTGWTYSRTQGQGSYTGQLVRTRATAHFPQVAVDPGTELIVRPDGSYAYRISDPTFKFGSFYRSQVTEESELNSTIGITVLGDSGYSVFSN